MSPTENSLDWARARADWLQPEGLPPEVGALMPTRRGGVSQGPYAGLNVRPPGLRADAADTPQAVYENQRRFIAELAGAQPVWLDQVHGVGVQRLTRADLAVPAAYPQADASISTEPGVACTVLVADCLPALLAAPGGRGVGAAHAGWRGLAAGVLEATVLALCEAAACPPSSLQVWLGACIGPRCFEVGEEVRQAFGVDASAFFQPTGVTGKYLADLPGLARWRLRAAGVTQVSGGQWCTASDASRFFSFRRDRITGRHAAAIWIR